MFQDLVKYATNESYLVNHKIEPVQLLSTRIYKFVICLGTYQKKLLSVCMYVFMYSVSF